VAQHLGLGESCLFSWPDLTWQQELNAQTLLPGREHRSDVSQHSWFYTVLDRLAVADIAVHL
jgi:hypothetical protein